jgi:hypothetical protein
MIDSSRAATACSAQAEPSHVRAQVRSSATCRSASYRCLTPTVVFVKATMTIAPSLPLRASIFFAILAAVLTEILMLF